MTAPSLDGWTVLRVEGEIDIARLEELEDLVLAECSGDCSDTVVDLSNVEFIDTTGVAWLLRSRDLFLDRGTTLRPGSTRVPRSDLRTDRTYRRLPDIPLVTPNHL